MKAQNQWFEDASGGLRWNLDTFKHRVRSADGTVSVRESVDVTFVRSSLPGSELASAFDVAADLERMGFNDPNKRYLSYVASEAAACGDALFPISAPTQAAPDGKYAQVYLLSAPECGARQFGSPGKASFSEAIAQQELIHNDGIVAPGAPHGCAAGMPPGMGHVCTGPLVFTEGVQNLDPERVDALYPFISVPLSEKVLDLGNDDYFKHPLPIADFEQSPYLVKAR